MTPHIATVFALLRTGDQIRLGWTANNDSEAMRAADVNRDELELRIERRLRHGNPKLMTFEIESQISRDNSARMLRTNRYG